MTAQKICILTETYFPVIGGGETQARGLANGLSNAGHQVMILTRKSDPNLLNHEKVDESQVYRLAPSGKSHLNKWGLLASALIALLRHRHQYDVIIVSGFRVLGLPAIAACEILGKRCILKADSLGEMSGQFFRAGLAKFNLSRDWLPFKIFLKARNLILRRSDQFVAISSAVFDELLEEGVDEARIRRIPNGVDIDRFKPVSIEDKVVLRKKLGLSTNEFIAVYIGRIVSYKGLPLLLEAWREICSRQERGLLVLVGEGGLDIHNCEKELRAYVDDHGLTRRIRFCGPKVNVEEYLQAGDLFVLPSESEAFGIALIEAMACGLPVIGSSVGGIKDIIEDNHNGLLVIPGDYKQLVESLNHLIAEPGLRLRLGQEAHEDVRDKYSLERVAAEYKALIEQSTTTSGLDEAVATK